MVPAMRWTFSPRNLVWIRIAGVPAWQVSTLYDVLGIRPDADAETVKRAFRRAVKAHHPDLQGGDEAASERIKLIIAANEILGDPEQRAAYDDDLAFERHLALSEW